MVTQDLSLEELTDRLNKKLKSRGLEPLQPRTMYRYVEKGLLESGGRGPGARYKESAIPKLVFVKQLQQANPKLSLDEIAEVVSQLSPGVIESVASGREPLEVMDLRQAVVSHLAATFREDSPDKRVGEGLGGGRYARVRFGGKEETEQGASPAALGRLADPDRAIPPDRAGKWTSVEVTRNFAISARGLDDRQANALEAIADWLRKMMR